MALWLALVPPTSGWHYFQTESTQALQVVFVNYDPAIPRPPVGPLAPQISGRISHTRPKVIALVPLTTKGPPTESADSIAAAASPDGEATVYDAPALRELCLHAYPVELASNAASSGEIDLRVFVMPDGRIGQGVVVSSSGDERLDLLTLKCLQANGHLTVRSDDSAPNGSWQRLQWFWSLP